FARFFFFSSRRRHTRFSRDWSSDVCSSDLDDIIATLTRTALAEGWSVRIVTGDKDFIQLLDEGVELYDPMKDQVTVAADVPGRQIGRASCRARAWLSRASGTREAEESRSEH